MTTIKELEKEINILKERNARVEADKAWETSPARRFIIALLTYALIVVFFVVMRLPNPFVNALIPTLAYVVSTLTLSMLKRIWLNR